MSPAAVLQVSPTMPYTPARLDGWLRIAGILLLASAQSACSQSSPPRPPVVQVIENRADLVGRVEGVAPHPSLQGYDLVTVAADSAADVAGYPNLLRERAAKPLQVTVPHERTSALHLAAGDRIALRARLAGPESVMADPESVVKR